MEAPQPPEPDGLAGLDRQISKDKVEAKRLQRSSAVVAVSSCCATEEDQQVALA